MKRKSRDRESRKILLFCLSKYCRSSMKLTDIAERCSISLSGLTRARDRVKRAKVTDKRLNKKLELIEKKIEAAKMQWRRFDPNIVPLSEVARLLPVQLPIFSLPEYGQNSLNVSHGQHVYE